MPKFLSGVEAKVKLVGAVVLLLSGRVLAFLRVPAMRLIFYLV
jgi:hypothetical protein